MRLVLVGILVLGVLATGHSQNNDWPKRITSKTKRTFLSYLNPHVGRFNVLIIDGKRFENVRGIKEFYMLVPHTNSVLFVVDEKDYSVTYHVFNMDTDEDVAIHARSSVFGHTIGTTTPRDTLTIGEAGQLVLCTTVQDAKRTLPNLHTVKSLYYLDLVKRAVVAKKTLFLDEAGHVIDQYDSPLPSED